MELQHLNVKFFAEGPADLDPFIPIFHRWIQEQVFQPALLIDVADYRHVPQGPGIVLIGYEFDFSMDETDGRLGLRFNQKAAIAGSNQERLRKVFETALRGLQLLEGEELLKGKLRVSRKNWEVLVNDRALAPNSPQTLEKSRGEFETFFRETLNADVSLKHNPDPRQRFGLEIQTAQPVDWKL